MTTDPKVLLKAPIYINFVGARAGKTQFFLSEFCKRCFKKSYGLFSQVFACRAETLTKTVFLML